MGNIKTNVRSGSKAKYKKHNRKIAPTKKQPFPPVLSKAQKTQATKPTPPPQPLSLEDEISQLEASLKPEHPNYIQQQLTGQGVNVDKELAAIEAAWAKEEKRHVEHVEQAPDNWWEQTREDRLDPNFE